MPSHPVGQRRDALRLLGLQDPVEPSEVVAAYRRLARQHHPDRGGDPDAFHALTRARDLLLAGTRSHGNGGTGTLGGRSVTVRQRPSRRLLRTVRRRLGRKGSERRHLE